MVFVQELIDMAQKIQTLLKEMKAPKNWKIVSQYDGHIEFANIKSNTTLTYHEEPLHVSILGRGRFQHEYLVGGNARRHDVSESTAKEYDMIITKAPEAKKIALEWMKEHPNG